MSDRRPSKLHDPAKALEWWRAEGSKMAIVELHEAVTDPVAVVRRGVESGTIKGADVLLCKVHQDIAITVRQAGTDLPSPVRMQDNPECWVHAWWKVDKNGGEPRPCEFVEATLVIGPVSGVGEDR